MDQDLRLQAMENDMKEVKTTLQELVEGVDRLSRGLYDDEENNHQVDHLVQTLTLPFLLF